MSATDDFPGPQCERDDTTSHLLYAARDIVEDNDSAKLLTTIQSVFPMLSAKSKAAALQIIVMAQTAAAAQLYVQLLRAHADEIADEFIPSFPRNSGAEVANVLFPNLLGSARHPQLAIAIFHMLLDFRQEDVVPDSIAREHHGRMTSLLRAEIVEARKRQKPSGIGWKYNEPYADHRDMIGLLFDLAGTLDSDQLLTVVQESRDLVDSRLRRFRAVALLTRGEFVSDEELDWIARSPRDRYRLVDQLVRIEMEERLPDACLDQKLLAEGHMVDWLCFGTELGREPDEIELIHKETRLQPLNSRLLGWMKLKTLIDYFFFKFRVTEEHWSTKDGWMVGMAGGYARNEQPTTKSDGCTFSRFDKFCEKSLIEHISDYLE